MPPTSKGCERRSKEYLDTVRESADSTPTAVHHEGSAVPTTFGEVVAKARKGKGLSLRDLAERVTKEDGSSISAQYLNDIEHGRRNPPPPAIIRQLAVQLSLDADYLAILANELPELDQRLVESSKPERVQEALQAFRRTLKRK